MFLLLAVLLALLVLAAAAGSVLRGPWAAGAAIGGSAVAALGLLLLGLAALLQPDTLPVVLPLAPGGLTLTVSLDGLSAWFLSILGVTALAACAWSLVPAADVHRARSAPLPLLLAGMALTVAAGDAVTLLLGLEAALLAAWALVAFSGHAASKPGTIRRAVLVSVLGAACLLSALALLGVGAVDLSFTALRNAPPQGPAAVLAPILALIGVLALMAPLQARMAAVSTALPAHVAVLAAGALGKVAIYLLARLLLDLGGQANIWWGPPLVLLGAAGAVLGALWALGASDLRGGVVTSTVGHAGLLVTLLGLVPLFRATDLLPLAALSAGALLLHALARALVETLGMLVAGQVERTAGSGVLDALGGLVHAMPLTALGAGAALVGLAGLPPALGFASAWVALQTLLAAWRSGGPPAQVVVAGTLALTVLALALGTVAAVRWFGLAFLGRPRTPRAMGGRDASGAALATLAILAALVLLGGLLPGPLLVLADPALRVLAGAAMEDRAGVLVLRAGDGMGAYLPLGLAMLLGGCLAALLVAVRATSRRSSVCGPAWDGGFAAPPPHLPFGDPACQPSATGLAQPIHRLLGLPWSARTAEVLNAPAPPTARYGNLLRRLEGLLARSERQGAAPLLAFLLAALAWLGWRA